MMFRSWIAEGVLNRFGEERPSLYLGKRKGRYRTYAEFYDSNDAFTGTLKLFLALVTKAGKEGLSDVDKANMRKNAMELSLYLSLIAIGVLTRSLADDDDDEPDYMANFLINQSIRLQGDLTFYTSPLSFEKITRSSLPAFAYVKDVTEFAVACKKYIQGKDIIRSGEYKGMSRITREFSQLFPITSQGYSHYNKVAKEQDY